MAEDSKTVLFSRLIESVPALLILLGAFLLVLGVAGGIKFHQWLPIPEVGRGLALGVAGALILALGYFAWTRRDVVPTCRNYRIDIDSPTNGDEVDTFDVRVTIKKPLPENYILRVLRIYSDNRLAPTGGEA